QEPRNRHRRAHRARRHGRSLGGAGRDAGRARVPATSIHPPSLAHERGPHGSGRSGEQEAMTLGADYFRIRERFDWALFISAALVAVRGIVTLYGATGVYSGARAEQYVNQVYGLVAGGILAVFAASVDYRHFERLGYVIYIGGVVCLVLVFLLGRDIRGSARWILLGSFQFQPSEFMKLALTIPLSQFFPDY